MTSDEKLDAILKEQVSQRERTEFLAERFTELETVLIGNEKFHQKGVLQRLAETEKYIENDRNMKLKVSGGVLVLSFIGSGLIWLLGKMFG
jgi:hypothetical protein